jgi:hypothetical protein|eukprot:COSAG06_NODE_1470_length_9353_cov_7.625351_4_plen_165_part_00
MRSLAAAAALLQLLLLQLLQLAPRPAGGQLLAAAPPAPGRDGGCEADVNGDGAVGVSDLLLVLGDFGRSDDQPLPTDVGGDGTVAVADLLLVLGAFGQTDCPPAPSSPAPGQGPQGAEQEVVGTRSCIDLAVEGHESRTSCVFVPDTSLAAGSAGLPLIIVLCV